MSTRNRTNEFASRCARIGTHRIYVRSYSGEIMWIVESTDYAACYRRVLESFQRAADVLVRTGVTENPYRCVATWEWELR